MNARVALALIGLTLAPACGKKAPGLGEPPTTQEVRGRLEKPTKDCARAAGVKLKGTSESWELVVVIAGSGEVSRVSPKGEVNPRVLSCAVDAMKGQKFKPFASAGTGEVERTVTISMFDPRQAPTTPPGFQPPG